MNTERAKSPSRWSLSVLLLLGVVLIFIGSAIGLGWGSSSKDTGQSLLKKPVVDDDPSIPADYRDLSMESKKSLIHSATGEVLADLYRDMTGESGIDFTYHNGQEADHMAILESLGGGVALIDYDGDGLLDIFVTGGGCYDGPDKKTIKGLGNRLYKNLGNWKFRDVTKEVGLDQPVFYSHGAAVSDYNRDGWPDLLVTGWGRMALYRNEPDGKGGRKFVEVSRQAGLPEGLWTTSAAWVDLDADGYPDLYVCQYVNWSFANNPKCAGYSAKFDRDVCPPKTFTGLPHHVFRNNGNGSFTDVTKEARLRPHTGDPVKDAENGKGLGVVAVDVDEDGKPDLYVANDTVDNFLYLNKSTPGKILFEEVGLPSGVARDDRGIPNGSMGTDAGDYDGNGRPALWCTNYENEMHGLYRNQGRGLFLFSTPASGIAAIGQLYVGFGTGFTDIDGHGWEDLVIANGHVIRFPQGATLKQRPVLLRNRGAGRYADITRQGGSYFRGEHMGRGLALGDLDNDGKTDLVFSHLNEPVVLLRNQADTGCHWLGVQLIGRDHRDVVGAKIVVDLGDRKLMRFAKGGGSYMSSNDRRHVFGLGKAERIQRLTVYWPPSPDKPKGDQQHWDGAALRLDRYLRIIEGKNTAEL
jgi:hypothetical protein